MCGAISAHRLARLAIRNMILSPSM